MTLHSTIHPRLQLPLTLLVLAMASGVHAQTERSVAAVHAPPPAAATPAAEIPQNAMPPQPLRVRSIDIGNAAQTLWDLQRAAPGVRPRPIDGDQASRSYQRYLKSFEYAIPEHYGSGLDIVKK